MQPKSLQKLHSAPVTAADIDELETLARAHENLAYRYRSAISQLRRRLSAEQAMAEHDRNKDLGKSGTGPTV